MHGYSPLVELVNDGFTDLIVHGILDPNRSLEDIKQEMKGIFERLVRTVPHPHPPVRCHPAHPRTTFTLLFSPLLLVVMTHTARPDHRARSRSIRPHPELR
jgi:hypothetical protein